MTFFSAEHHYQFKRLQHHGKLEESYQVLEADTGFQVMKIAQEVLPDDKVKPSWHEKAVKEMLEMNILKYSSCAHVKKALMCSKVVLAEAMSNIFWGLGLPPDMTVNTLSDYWPSKNNLGKILVCIREDFVSEQHGSSPIGPSEKHKATSPLESHSKSVKC